MLVHVVCVILNTANVSKESKKWRTCPTGFVWCGAANLVLAKFSSWIGGIFLYGYT
uniref:Uncharacterized protein n=1 Tax=Octopus bimaculoides TaxID=37653 RepID=A0A0L8G2G4_OCTBM